MPTQRSSWIWVDLSPTIAVANQNQTIVKPAPVAGTIKEVWIGINTILTTGGGTLAVANGSANVLSSTNYNLGSAGDLAAGVHEAATLNTNTANLRVAAGGQLKATWVLTTAAITNGAACLVALEPDLW